MRNLASRRFIGAAAVSVVIACGGSGGKGSDEHQHQDVASDVCHSETGFDTYSDGMSKTSDGGMTVALTGAVPAPPAQFDNEWTLVVTDAAGEPVVGATIEVLPWMTEHGHGSNVAPVVQDNEDGTYTVTDINLHMVGVWDTRVTVATSDGAREDVTFSFCVR
jgi:hypothetical protein